MRRILRLSLILWGVFILLIGCDKDDDDNPVTPVLLPPSTPVDVEIETVEEGIQVSWADTTADAEEYAIERQKLGDLSFMLLSRIDVQQNQFIDTDVLPGVYYSYRLRAYNEAGYSDYTSPVSIRADGIMEGYDISIEFGAETTEIRHVRIYLPAENADSMRLSNTDYFEWVDWEPWSAVAAWILPAGEGTKTVYVQYLTVTGDTVKGLFDTIDPVAPEVAAVANGGEDSTSFRSVTIDLQTLGNATEMVVSNTDSLNELDEDEEWVPFEQTFEWELFPGPAPKMIHIKVRNGFEIEAQTNLTVYPVAPTVGFSINDSSEYTISRLVKLNLSATGDPTHVAIGNGAMPDDPDWMAYADEIEWQVTEGLGNKRIIVQVKNDFQLIGEAIDSIAAVNAGRGSITVYGGNTVSTDIVALQLISSHADSMQVSNDPEFAGATWQAYRNRVENWTLDFENQADVTHVYARFKNSFNVPTDPVDVQVERSLGLLSLIVDVESNELVHADIPDAESTTTLTVYAFDDMNTPAADGTVIYGMMAIYPGMNNPQVTQPTLNDVGPASPGNPYDVPFDSVTISNGRARFEVSASGALGAIQVTFWTYRNENRSDSLVVLCNDLRVVAGPPAELELAIDPVALDDGGALYVLNVAASLFDELDNPVSTGKPVEFSIEGPAGIGQIAQTGNENPDGQSYGNIANTFLSYRSLNTNDTVLVTATVPYVYRNGALLSASTLFNLPLQNGMVSFFVDPCNYNYSQMEEDATFLLSCFIVDGCNHWINDQSVTFSSECGRIVDNLGNVNPVAITGPHNNCAPLIDLDENGCANRFLSLPFEEAFPDVSYHSASFLTGVQINGIENLSGECVIYVNHNL